MKTFFLVFISCLFSIALIAQPPGTGGKKKKGTKTPERTELEEKLKSGEYTMGPSLTNTKLVEKLADVIEKYEKNRKMTPEQQNILEMGRRGYPLTVDEQKQYNRIARHAYKNEQQFKTKIESIYRKEIQNPRTDAASRKQQKEMMEKTRKSSDKFNKTLKHKKKLHWFGR